jgi:hypothetical protein
MEGNTGPVRGNPAGLTVVVSAPTVSLKESS